MYKKSILLLILLNLFLCDAGQIRPQNVTRKSRQSHGCSLSGSGEEYGTCQRWSKCQSAQIDFQKKGTAPVYCEYDRFDPIVCCADTGVAVEPNNKLEENREKRISEKKCIEAFAPKRKTTISLISDLDVRRDPVDTGVGGIRTSPNEFTHMASLGWKKASEDDMEYDFLCEGTLISEDFVLTAAHCASFGGVEPIIVRIGGESLTLRSPDSNIPIKSIYVHPEYRQTQIYKDIALMELETRSIHTPACLWQTQEITDSEVIAIAYSHTAFAGPGSNELVKVNLNIFPKDQCQEYYKPDHLIENGIDDSQICAGDPNKMPDNCQGDSGGILMVKVNKSEDEVIPYILGVLSYGQGCAGGPPSIYVRVSFYLDWIESIVWPN